MSTPVETRPDQPPTGAQEPQELRDALEVRFQRQTDRLIRLTGRYRCSHDAALAASIAAARLALAETAHALQRMAEGRYGVCERCGSRIQRWRLLTLPHASLCLCCDRFGATGPSRTGRYEPV
jgi:RNA polymerase-binding transcription factor DksA